VVGSRVTFGGFASATGRGLGGGEAGLELGVINRGDNAGGVAGSEEESWSSSGSSWREISLVAVIVSATFLHRRFTSGGVSSSSSSSIDERLRSKALSAVKLKAFATLRDGSSATFFFVLGFFRFTLAMLGMIDQENQSYLVLLYWFSWIDALCCNAKCEF
jgi:hypothetical protein